MPDKDEVQAIVKERGRVYGDPEGSHENIALAWTGQLQQHYGIKLSHTIPPWLVAQLMAQLKLIRSGRLYKDDNYVDADAYVGFAANWQSKDPMAQLKQTTATQIAPQDSNGIPS